MASMLPRGFDILGIASSLGEIRIDVPNDFPTFAPVLEKTGMPFLYATGKSSLELAYESASELLGRGVIDPKQVGCLVVVTQSPDEHLPALSCRLQDRLNLGNGVLAFDINQGCSGFVQALLLAVGLLASIEHCLIITVDRYRSKLSSNDRSTQSVFSDASAAVLVTASNQLEIRYSRHHTDGSAAEKLQQPLGQSLHMSGADVFLWTKRVVGPMIRELAEAMANGAGPPQFAFLHQASKLVLDGLVPALSPNVAVPRNLGRIGNTVSSSIPMLLEKHLNEFRTTNSLLCGFGVGLSATALGVVRSST